MRSLLISLIGISFSLNCFAESDKKTTWHLVEIAGVTGTAAGSAFGAAWSVRPRTMRLSTMAVGRLSSFAGYAAAIAAEAAPVLGVAAVAGASAVGLSCLYAHKYFEGDGRANQMINCISSPLGLINKNPRDRMYVQSVTSCDPARLEARVASPNGDDQLRVFTAVDGALTQVQILDVREPYGMTVQTDGSSPEFTSGVSYQIESGTFAIPPKVLRNAQSLVQDYQYYRALCANQHLTPGAVLPEQLQRRAYDSRTPKTIFTKMFQRETEALAKVK